MARGIRQACRLLQQELGLSSQAYLFSVNRTSFHLSYCVLYPKSKGRPERSSVGTRFRILDVAHRADVARHHTASSRTKSILKM